MSPPASCVSWPGGVACWGTSAGGRVLGGTIVGPRAGELIHELALAMRTGMFAGRLAQTVHAYPTWSMAVQQAAAQLVTPPAATAMHIPAGNEH
ncbi:hypothetical protein RIF23_16305 [Lipingzhangella sp. LS1_29]|uniref:Pyridine nucleotide-disulphide oxidoreductase dimerisation domain-containing protein n=1 Tax=Lipingzhangella rawalii TaxID=2055835 RepID=A0ABU2H976_9ACTN|nr:hypothetical protein [Lipingzhangella rawalii]MDS1271857.1 hypothetical protein [Lipingzhangella rawalii]